MSNQENDNIEKNNSFDPSFDPDPPQPLTPPDERETATASDPEDVTADEISGNSVTGGNRSKLPLWLIIVVGIVMLLMIAGLSAYSGYNSGIDQRVSAQDTQSVQAVQTQYALARADIDAGNVGLSEQRLSWFQDVSPEFRALTEPIQAELEGQYELALREIEAKQFSQAQARLEWILEWQPEFPGAMDALAEVIFQSRITPTPTPLPTPTLVPTEDIRTQENLYNDAQQALTAGDWSVAIETLLSLRKLDPEYEAVKLDGMLYVAYRNRGVDKIRGKGDTDATITGVDLQGGSYDLTLAEQFGTLDQEAEAWRKRAKWYLTGASYWGVDWGRAVSYFELLFIEAPFLSDGTTYAKDRYLEGLVKYGDWLAARGDWCSAQEQYQKALAALDNDNPRKPEIEPTALYSSDQCNSGAPPPEGSETATPEP